MKWQDFYNPPEHCKREVEKHRDAMLKIQLGQKPTPSEAGSNNDDLEHHPFQWNTRSLFADQDISWTQSKWTYNDDGLLSLVRETMPVSTIIEYKWPQPSRYAKNQDPVYGREW